MARTVASSSGSPVPAACERTIAPWSLVRSRSPTLVSASAPNPVFTPYTGASPLIARLTTARLGSMLAAALGASSALASPRATSTTSATARASPLTITVRMGDRLPPPGRKWLPGPAGWPPGGRGAAANPGHLPADHPNVAAGPSRPAGVTHSARRRAPRSSQPSSSSRAVIAAPSAPLRCGLRSVQSRHSPAKRRRALRSVSISMPNARRVSSPTAVTSNVRGCVPCACGASPGGRPVPVPGRDQNAAGQQRVEQGGARPACQVVVAGAGRGQRDRLPRRAQAAHRQGRAEVADGLRRGRDLVAGTARACATTPKRSVTCSRDPVTPPRLGAKTGTALTAPGHVLKGPGVAVRVGDARVVDAAEILDRADFRAALDERGAGLLDVADDQVQAAQAADGHVEVGDAGGQDYRAGRARRGELDDPDTFRGPNVDVHPEAEAVGVEVLGPVDVADRHRHEFEQKHAGTHGRVLIGLGVGHRGSPFRASECERAGAGRRGDSTPGSSGTCHWPRP